MIGVAGAMWGFLRLGSWEPLAFDINRSFQILFMVIIGGLGSILGSFLGAAFIVLTPIVLNQIPGWLGIPMRSEEHTSELKSLMRISYAVLCLKKKTQLRTK